MLLQPLKPCTGVSPFATVLGSQGVANRKLADSSSVRPGGRRKLGKSSGPAKRVPEAHGGQYLGFQFLLISERHNDHVSSKFFYPNNLGYSVKSQRVEIPVPDLNG